MSINIDKSKLNPFYHKYLDIYEPTTEAPIEFLLTSLLPAIGSAISIKRHLVHGTAKIYTNIWSLILGESTLTRKSTALNIGTKFVEHKQANCETEEIFILSTSTSTNAFIEALKENKHSLLKTSEIKSLIESMNMNYNGDFKSKFTELFDVPISTTLHYRTHNEGKPFKIDKPIFSLAAASTVEWFTKAIKISDSTSGFLPRILICKADPTAKKIPVPPIPNEDKEKELLDQLSTLYDLVEKKVTIDNKAKGLYGDFYNRSRIEMSSIGESKLNPFIGRLVDCYCLKFAIIEVTLAGKDIIRKEEMERAIYLTEFYISQIKEIIYTVINNPVHEIKRNILKIIDEKTRVSKSELYDICKGTDQLNHILAHLEEVEKIEKIHERTSGSKKPTTFYLKKR